MAFVSGKEGKVEFGATAFNFQEYSLNINGDLPDVSHFGAGGGRVMIDGVVITDMTVTGAFDTAVMAMTRGKEYTTKLYVTDAIYFQNTVRIRGLRVDNKYVEHPRVTIDAGNSDGKMGTISLAGEGKTAG